MKQTAVEWLVDELNKNIGLTKFVVNCDEAYKQEILGIIQQAKEMEKEQICDAFYYGVKVDEWTIENPYTQAEQYYKQTYNK